MCSSNSLSSSTCSTNFNKNLQEARSGVSTSNPLLVNSGDTETLIDIPLNNNITITNDTSNSTNTNINLLEDNIPLPMATSNPVPIGSMASSEEQVLSTSAPTSASGSPILPPAVTSSRPTVFKHRKSSSVSSGGSFNMMLGEF